MQRTARALGPGRAQTALPVGEPLLGALVGLVDLDGVVPYLPFQVLDAADGTGGESLLSYGPGLAMACAWIAAIGGGGLLRTSRRDIS